MGEDGATARYQALLRGRDGRGKTPGVQLKGEGGGGGGSFYLDTTEGAPRESRAAAQILWHIQATADSQVPSRAPAPLGLPDTTDHLDLQEVPMWKCHVRIKNTMQSSLGRQRVLILELKQTLNRLLVKLFTGSETTGVSGSESNSMENLSWSYHQVPMYVVRTFTEPTVRVDPGDTATLVQQGMSFPSRWAENSAPASATAAGAWNFRVGPAVKATIQCSAMFCFAPCSMHIETDKLRASISRLPSKALLSQLKATNKGFIATSNLSTIKGL